jgi:transcriptional regulator with XRE-family HTH domain
MNSEDLNKLRKKNKMTIDKLAKMLGYTHMHTWKLCNGYSKPTERVTLMLQMKGLIK